MSTMEDINERREQYESSSEASNDPSRREWYRGQSRAMELDIERKIEHSKKRESQWYRLYKYFQGIPYIGGYIHRKFSYYSGYKTGLEEKQKILSSKR